MLLEGNRNSVATPEQRQTIERAIVGLRRAVDEGRRIIQGVRSVVLDDLGIVAAIKELVLQAAPFGVDAQFEWDKSVERLPKSLETAVYRVAQEALTNVKKHSGSKTAKIQLCREGSQVVLRVEDSGCGFDTKATRSGGFGLRGMTERVRLLGGNCSIQSRPGAGTQVVARFPIPAE
jgi:protein-histidine pros-kinase